MQVKQLRLELFWINFLKKLFVTFFSRHIQLTGKSCTLHAIAVEQLESRQSKITLLLSLVIFSSELSPHMVCIAVKVSISSIKK